MVIRVSISTFADHETGFSTHQLFFFSTYLQVDYQSKRTLNLVAMKFEWFLIIIHLFGWKYGELNAEIGNFKMKNFFIFYGVSNVTKEETHTLVNLIASPAIANTSNDPNSDMFESKTVILNYSIVNIAEPENFIKIPLKNNHTVDLDYFENLLQKYNTANKNTTKLSLKHLRNFLQKCPQFSGVSVITNMKPGDNDLLPEILQLIKNRSLEVVISPFDSSTIKSQYVGYRYFHPKDPVSEEYRQINKIKYDADEGSFLKRILNEFVTTNFNGDPLDTSVAMIFDWFSLIQFTINSNLQHSLNLFAKELYSNQLLHSYQGHSARIRKLFVVCSYTDVLPQIPVEDIDLSIRRDFEYFDEMIVRLANINDTSRFSMKSLVKALNLSSPNGMVYLFVGTQPQHSDLMPAALKLMKDKNISVEVAYTKTKTYKQPDIEYQRINEASYKNRPTIPM